MREICLTIYNNSGIIYKRCRYGDLSDICGCSSMVEFQPSKLAAWVRFPSPAPLSLKKGTAFTHAPVAQLDRATAF